MEKTGRQRLCALLLAVAIFFCNLMVPAIHTHAAGAQMEPSSMSDTGPLATSSGVISGSNLNELWPGTYTATNGRITLNDRSYEGTFADASGYFTRDDFQIMAVYVQPAGESTATKLGSQYASSYNGGLVASYSVGYYRNYYDTPQEGYLDYRLVVTAVGDGDIWFYVKDHVGYSVYHITCSVTPSTHNVYFYTVEAQAPTTVTVNSGAQVPQNRIPSVADYQDTNGVTQKFIGWSKTENDASNLLSAAEIAALSIAQDTTFYAVYAAQYGVTYQTGTDVSITDAAKYTPTESVIINADNIALSKDGYTFASWSVQDADQNVIATATQLSGATFAMPASEAVVTANWDLVSYPITYTLDGGTNHSANPASYHIESGTIVLQNPTKTGYSFAGWTSEALSIASPIKSYQFDAMLTKGDLDFTAHWSINSYDVTFAYVDENGAPISVFQDELAGLSYDVAYKSTLASLENALVLSLAAEIVTDEVTYTFSHWETATGAEISVEDIVSAPVVSEVAYYAVYIAADTLYTVSFVDYNGDVLQEAAQYPWGAQPTQPEDTPTRAAKGSYTYTFAGWDKEVVAVNGDVTYKATYNATYVGASATPAPTASSGTTTPVTPSASSTPETPVAPITPATPAPVAATPTPAPLADTETDIEEAQVPLAPAQSPSVEIEDEEVPMVATATRESWALMNLLFAIGTISISLVLLVGYLFIRRESEYKDLEEDDSVKYNGLLRLVSIFPAVVSIVVFLLTENMKNPMVILDRWTLVMALIALIQFAIVLKVRKDDGVIRDDELTDLFL